MRVVASTFFDLPPLSPYAILEKNNFLLKLKHTFLNFNILGFGSTLRKRQKQMRKLWKPSWKWSVNIWHPHLVQPMLKGCSLMGGWWQLIIDLPYQEKSWTKFSFCKKMRWWQTLILAGYKKHSFVFQCTTKTIHMWWTKYNIYSSFLLLRGEGGCVCVCVFHPSPCYQIRKIFFLWHFSHELISIMQEIPARKSWSLNCTLCFWW